MWLIPSVLLVEFYTVYVILLVGSWASFRFIIIIIIWVKDTFIKTRKPLRQQVRYPLKVNDVAREEKNMSKTENYKNEDQISPEDQPADCLNGEHAQNNSCQR